jgi:hypothetical protein
MSQRNHINSLQDEEHLAGLNIRLGASVEACANGYRVILLRIDDLLVLDENSHCGYFEFDFVVPEDSSLSGLLHTNRILRFYAVFDTGIVESDQDYDSEYDMNCLWLSVTDN